jgi:hypothetical protein
MKRIFIFLIIIPSSLYIYGQKTDSTAKQHFSHNYFSINPLNCALQQAGITYEYKTRRFGFSITTGFVYHEYGGLSQWFMAGPSSYENDYSNYSGFFIDPQINFYLTRKDKINEKGNLSYISIKFVYKHIKCDSTGIYLWENGPDQSGLYRNQVDRCNITGAFISFGVKHYKKHFFYNYYAGLELLNVNHNMVVAGQYVLEGGYILDDAGFNTFHFPQKDYFTQGIITISTGISFGYRN